MKKIILFCCLIASFPVFADNTLNTETQAATQHSAQVSLGPNNQDAQQINKFFDKADYKHLKRHKTQPLFKVPSHD